MEIKVIDTEDGSKTLFSDHFQSNYHSSNGAVQESGHIFIKSGLEYYHKLHKKDKYKILEFGFGTGLNMLLTLDYAMNNDIEIEYFGLEKYLLNIDVIKKIDYCEILNCEVFREYYFNIFIGSFAGSSYSDKFHFTGLLADFIEFESDEKFDLIYFDPFGPSEHPEVWQLPFLKIIPSIIFSGGVLTTFSVKGSFRRDLLSLDFNVEKIEGPPGKREITRATKK